MLFVPSLDLFALLWAVSLVFAKPLRPRGFDTIAPYLNLTSISTTPPATPTSRYLPVITNTPPYPISGTGTGLITKDNGGRPQPTDQGSIAGLSASKNISQASCTVNIPQANIDWWYLATYEVPIGTLTKMVNSANDTTSYMTLVPATDTFDVTSAISSDYAYTTSPVFDPVWNVTWMYLEPYTVTPMAEITSVVTRTGALPLPSNNIIPADDVSLYSLDIDSLPTATVAITGASGTAFVATSTTPVLYFSAYEVETPVPSTAADGKVSYETTTETFNLPDVYAYSYDLKGIEDYAVATGTVPDEFLQQIPQSSCAPGLFQAVVTVLVVVDTTYVHFIGASPFIVHIESSVLGFEDPTTTEPDVVVAATGKAKPTTAKSDGSTTDDHGGAAQTKTEDGNGPVVTPGPAVSSAFENGHNAGNSIGQGPTAQDPPQQSVGTIGSETVKIGPSSVVVVGSITLNPGGAPITIGGTPVSLVPSATAIVIGDTTSVLPQILSPGVNNPAPPILTIGSSTLTANAATQFFIAPGQTLTPGGTATVGGTVVSLGPSASFLVVGGSTQILSTGGAVFTPPAATAQPVIVVGSSTITGNPGSTFVVGGQTLAPGQEITVGGTTVSLGPSASFVVINGQTSSVAHVVPQPTIEVAGSTFTESPGSSFVINGQTLAPGGQPITVDGTTLSLAPSASFVVINGQTSAIAQPAAQITPPPIVIGGTTFNALPGAGTTFIIGDQTLTPGGVITVSGSTISLAPGATALIINGQTTILNPQASITNAPLLTVGSQTYTAVSGTTFIISGQTLTPGGTITVDGTTISLAPGATQLIYGSAGHSTTETLFPATTTKSQSITGTGASAGATGVAGGPAATSKKGASSILRPTIVEACVVAVLLGIQGLLA